MTKMTPEMAEQVARIINEGGKGLRLVKRWGEWWIVSGRCSGDQADFSLDDMHEAALEPWDAEEIIKFVEEGRR